MSFSARFHGEKLACLRGEHLVFAALDFALEPGGALLLVGPNGSGKSSLLRLMAGLIRPASGKLRWGDEIVSPGEDHGRRLAYLGHLDAIKPSLTVAEHLSFHRALAPSPLPLSRQGRGGSAVPPAPSPLAGEGRGEGAVAFALDALDLTDLADTPGRLLSAGQRRRLSIARLLARPAPLWLLDEPTNGLDEASLARFRALVAAHREAGGLVVASTHVDLGLTDAARLDLAEFAPKPVDMAGWA
jgi:heme exporter protein A